MPSVLQLIVAKFRSNKHLRYGLPFITFVVGGSFVLRDFRSVRYDYRTTESISEREAREKYGWSKNKKTFEEMHKEYMEKEFSDDYDMKRGPRPWEPETMKQVEERKLQKQQQ